MKKLSLVVIVFFLFSSVCYGVNIAPGCIDNIKINESTRQDVLNYTKQEPTNGGILKGSSVENGKFNGMYGEKFYDTRMTVNYENNIVKHIFISIEKSRHKNDKIDFYELMDEFSYKNFVENGNWKKYKYELISKEIENSGYEISGYKFIYLGESENTKLELNYGNWLTGKDIELYSIRIY